jgi:hypothetical protein
MHAPNFLASSWFGSRSIIQFARGRFYRYRTCQSNSFLPSRFKFGDGSLPARQWFPQRAHQHELWLCAYIVGSLHKNEPAAEILCPQSVLRFGDFILIRITMSGQRRMPSVGSQHNPSRFCYSLHHLPPFLADIVCKRVTITDATAPPRFDRPLHKDRCADAKFLLSPSARAGARPSAFQAGRMPQAC